jgi:hypothetical protein
MNPTVLLGSLQAGLFRAVRCRSKPWRSSGTPQAAFADPPPDPVNQRRFVHVTGRPGFFPRGSSGSSTAQARSSARKHYLKITNHFLNTP